MMTVESLAMSTVELWADQVKRSISSHIAIDCQVKALQLIECVDVMMMWN